MGYKRRVKRVTKESKRKVDENFSRNVDEI